MSCQEFESVSVELARGSLLDAATGESARAHADACPTCAARLRRERALSVALRDVGAAMRERSAPARVEAALLATVRARREGADEGVGVASARTDTQRDPRRGVAPSYASISPLFAARGRRAFYGVAIAASLLVVALFAWRALHSTAAPDSRAEVAREPRNVNNSAPVKVDTNDKQDVQGAQETATKDRPQEEIASAGVARGRDSRAVHSSARRAASSVEALPISFRVDGGRVTPDDAASSASANRARAAEIAATGFVPLGGADDSAPLDSGQMVRVDVPRAALAAYGLPVNAARAGETVRADVLLAHDGTARAIRLVP